MNLQELLTDQGISFRRGGEHHHVRQGWIGIDCPFCLHASGKYHLGLNESGGFGSCWKCGPHSLVDTLKQLLGVKYASARTLVDSVSFVSSGKTPVVRGRYKRPAGVVPLLSCHRKYLEQKRNFDPEEITALWSVQGIGLSAEYPWRLFLPIIHEGSEVSWTTRTIGDAEPRYLNAPPELESLSPKKILYGSDYVRNTAIVCEGPTDVWRVGPGAVAVMGLQYTTQQAALLTNIQNRVICFDNSNDAQQRASKLANELSLFPGTTHVVQLDSDDPGSASSREIALLRKSFL